MCLKYGQNPKHMTYLHWIPFLRTSHRLKSISRHFANYRQYLARRENAVTLSTKKKAALSHILNEGR